MPINLFDCFLVAFLIAGVMRGRMHGVSEEFIRVLKWLLLVGLCALVYHPLGALIESAGYIDEFTADVVAYLGMALCILLAFSPLERRLNRKFGGTDTFGRSEYYLGMGSGLVRYACVLMVGLALLNARSFTPGEIKAMEQYQVDAYGSAVFPTLRNFQQLVFENSVTGSVIKQNLGFLLINSVPPAPSEPQVPTTLKPAQGKHVSQAHRGT